MKKYFVNITAVAAALMALTFTSCKNNNKPTPEPEVPVTPMNIVSLDWYGRIDSTQTTNYGVTAITGDLEVSSTGKLTGTGDVLFIDFYAAYNCTTPMPDGTYNIGEGQAAGTLGMGVAHTEGGGYTTGTYAQHYTNGEKDGDPILITEGSLKISHNGAETVVELSTKFKEVATIFKGSTSEEMNQSDVSHDGEPFAKSSFDWTLNQADTVHVSNYSQKYGLYVYTVVMNKTEGNKTDYVGLGLAVKAEGNDTISIPTGTYNFKEFDQKNMASNDMVAMNGSSEIDLFSYLYYNQIVYKHYYSLFIIQDQAAQTVTYYYPVTGTVNVAKAGDSYTITVNAMSFLGSTLNSTYTGSLIFPGAVAPAPQMSGKMQCTNTLAKTMPLATMFNKK